MLAEKTTYEIMTPQSVGLNENKMVLGKLSGKHAFEDRLKELGYIDLKNEDITSAFEKFKILADKKKVITDRDIEALIEENTAEIPKTYEIENFQFISGRKLLSTATIELKKGNEIIVEAATGDGPVDAAFKAIERATGIIISLEDYNLKSVTEGKDALGEVAIKVSKNNLKFIGRGLSTDIIEASVIAYVNVINKIINEFGEDNLNG
jgi:2-isopropylmalate synthase